jgi:hypothetical protein
MTRLTSEKPTQERKTKMPSKRNMMTKEDADLFQKATEAMRILGESPDAARRFLDAVNCRLPAKCNGSIPIAVKASHSLHLTGRKPAYTTRQSLAGETVSLKGARCARIASGD